MYKLAVFGNPIKHSLSPDIHAQFAQQTGLTVNYSKILAPIDAFSNTVNQFINEGANGFNITVPFKLDAYNFATELTLNAKTASAVNTIKVDGNRLIGENTDGIGLVNDLIKNLKITLKDKVILILGAGGATQGVLLPLLKENPKRIMIANRTASKAEKLKQDFSDYGNTCGFGLDKIKDDPVDIIINATSASLDGKMPNIANGCANGAICYDLMYGKQTPFMDWAKENNAAMIVDGLGMLVEQAACSFEFWTGSKPDTQSVIEKIKALDAQ
ncbi:Shikimate 5-dehydrogenase I alpha [Bathymodiolus heckerae thiotrophic gill symbiont]|uniref:shikimate dehydrogenase n=1 Tax=Bathymodiolus heckerae thiotrophic gill symbiont TaxID=1052212 RepID=UPI0010BAD58C|nr:shikimate dehydrogenase [Bathymodiolus heckerae thiotrophic gill symbiont]CAC9588510.1 Shikimate 5-dehydrogenase I alpha (EC 1.1.1.25) [uncultured Gammaproteobacteria bacterium]SHN90478.1 Shikimate 5-dehydrogenase I alpha [Bathymodiolus heckerae thiotrophic gill symbiont]